MKIAVNTRLLIKNQMEGIGWYTHELMSRIVRSHPEHDFYFFFDRPFHKDFIYANNVHPIILFPPARHVFLIEYWFDIKVKRKLKEIGVDLFFSPDSINMLNPGCKTITSIHDVNFISNPGNFGFLLRRFYSKRTPSTILNSDKIITVSEFSKRDILKHFKLQSEKIVSIYNACRPGFKPLSEIEKTKTKLKYTDGKDYFVFIGGLYQRKNLENLVRAFEIYKLKSNSEMKLLIAGRPMKESAALIQLVQKSPVKKDIILTGRIESDEEVKKILASAFCLTYISVLEGFGMPMVEAMNSGVPIIASNTSSMPEIGGEAALYADPFNIEEIAERMLEMTVKPDLRNKLISLGLEQSKKFDWDKSAAELWKVMSDVLNS